MSTPTVADTVLSLGKGQVALLPSPFDINPDEHLEFWVTNVREDTGVREGEFRYHGVFMQRVAGKPTPEGKVSWTVLS